MQQRLSYFIELQLYETRTYPLVMDLIVRPR